MKRLLSLILILLSVFPITRGQEFQRTSAQKAVMLSGDILVFAAPVAGIITGLAMHDWQGIKQEAFTGLTAIGTTFVLKYTVNKTRPDFSNNHSFPSMHTTVSFAGAAYIQRRYGWGWGIPAYALSVYVGWSRIYAKKHDIWDVIAGAAIGIGSAYIYTRPFAKKHKLSICPMTDGDHMGVYANLTF